MTRNYTNNLNKTMFKYNQSMNKVISGRKFTKMSEDVSGGARALRIRASLYKNEQIQKNLLSAGEELRVAENFMMAVQGITTQAHAEAIKAQNGTNNPTTEYLVFATNFDSYADQVFQQFNGVYGDKHLFGGTYNGGYPFSYGADDELLYLGIPVQDIEKNADGDYVYPNPDILSVNFDRNNPDHWRNVKYSEDVYIDAGLNITVNGTLLDPRSAIQMSVSGLESFGYGTSDVEYTDVNGTTHAFNVPNNICELLRRMSECLREAQNAATLKEDGEEYLRDEDGEFVLDDVGNRVSLSTVQGNAMNEFAALDVHMQEMSRKLMIQVADVGVRGNYMDNMLARYEDQYMTLQEMQITTERTNDAEEITTMRSHEFAWNLTLQFGSMFLPKSLMDYIR